MASPSIVQKCLVGLLLFSQLFSACGLPMNPSSNTKAIIGKDDRTVLKSPVSARPVAVLKVKEDYGSRSLCYATLTSPMILTTAAHCLEYLTFEHLGQRHLRNHISADFDYSEKRLITDIIDVFEDLDLVQLRLDKPMIQSPLAPGRGVNTYDPYLPLTILTAPQTILETIKINPRERPRNDLPELTTVAFPSSSGANSSPSLTREVWTQYSQSSPQHSMDDLGFISYELDTVPGYSGAPLLQGDRLVGIHLGYDTLSKQNVGIALTALYSPYRPERESRLAAIRSEGLSINKIRKWTEELTKDPIKTLEGTVTDLDPTNPRGSAHPSLDSLRETLQSMDITSPHSDFRKALGRIDPDQKVGKFLERNEKPLLITAAIVLCAYGGYYLVSSGAITTELVVIVDTAVGPVKLASITLTPTAGGVVGGATGFAAIGGLVSDNTGTDYTQDGEPIFVNQGISSSPGQPSNPSAPLERIPPKKGKYKDGQKVTSTEIAVDGKSNVKNVLERISALTKLDPKLSEQGLRPELIQQLNALIQQPGFDPAKAKELRKALDDLSQAIKSQDPQLASDIDDIADAIAMKNEYGLGVPKLSETRKLDRQQQEALHQQQIRQSRQFIQERLEDDDDKALRSFALEMAVQTGVMAFRSYDMVQKSYDQYTYFVQRSLEITWEFANFTADFLVPSYMSFLGGQKLGPNEQKLSQSGWLQVAVDTAIAIVPGWMRKGKKATDVFKEIEVFLDTSSDGGKALKESFTAGSREMERLGLGTLEEWKLAEDLARGEKKSLDWAANVVNSAKKLGITSADETKLLAKALNAQKINPFELAPTHALTMSNREFTALKGAMEKDGMLRETIKTVTHNGQKYIVDGHHRARAAKELGWKEVPIEEVSLPYLGYKTIDDLFN